MATKKRTKKRVDLPALPVRSQGKRADWDMVKKLVAWLNEHSDRDRVLALSDVAFALREVRLVRAT